MVDLIPMQYFSPCTKVWYYLEASGVQNFFSLGANVMSCGSAAGLVLIPVVEWCPDASCMAYLPAFTNKIAQMYVHMPHMEHLGLGILLGGLVMMCAPCMCAPRMAAHTSLKASS